MQIEDAGGTGVRAKVNSEGHLNTRSVTEELISHRSHEDAKAYFVHSSYTTTGVNQRVLSILNTSEDNLYIHEIHFASDTACKMVLEKVTAGTGAGTDVVPVNLNLTSGNSATGTFKGSAEVTGITAATHFGHWNQAADSSLVVNMHGALILGQNDEIAVKCAENGPALGVTIFFSYH